MPTHTIECSRHVEAQQSPTCQGEASATLIGLDHILRGFDGFPYGFAMTSSSHDGVPGSPALDIGELRQSVEVAAEFLQDDSGHIAHY